MISRIISLKGFGGGYMRFSAKKFSVNADSVCRKCLPEPHRQALDGKDVVNGGSKMTQMEKTIISFIVDYYRENLFYPSYDEIAEGIGRAKATVHRYMGKLEDEGIIIRKADYSPQYRLINMGFILGGTEKG